MDLVIQSLFIIYSGFATYLANELSFRHIEDMFDLDRILAVKYNYANQEWATVGVVIAKLSISLQLIRIMGTDNKWTRWSLYFLIGSLGVFSVVDCIIMFAQCSPPRALWDSAIPHTCWDPNIRIHYAIFVASRFTFLDFGTEMALIIFLSSGWNVFADFVFAALPIRFILQETTTWEQRISTAFLLALGVT